LVGNDTGDDAAVYRLDDNTAIIVTVDFFTPITDDPYEFGLVAAANSLSDVYAMGGKPLVALNVVGFPAELAVDMLGDVLKGGYDKAMEANCLIVGGHTVEGVRLIFETCVDDYGEVWIDGECDRERGTVQGFNVPQRILINIESHPGETHNIAILAANDLYFGDVQLECLQFQHAKSH